MKKHRITSLIVVAIMMVALFSTNVSAIVWPTTSTKITQRFSSSHEAIDIGPVTAKVSGDPIYSFAGGYIYSYAYNTLAGYTAHINHPTSSSTQYIYTRSSHMTNPSILSGITTSEDVSAGTKIGEMNTTGTDTTGVHLHYVMRYNSVAYNASSGWYAGTAFDPEAYFNANLSAKSNIASRVDLAVINRTVNSAKTNYGIYYEYDPNATEKSLVN